MFISIPIALVIGAVAVVASSAAVAAAFIAGSELALHRRGDAGMPPSDAAPAAS